MAVFVQITLFESVYDKVNVRLYMKAYYLASQPGSIFFCHYLLSLLIKTFSRFLLCLRFEIDKRSGTVQSLHKHTHQFPKRCSSCLVRGSPNRSPSHEIKAFLLRLDFIGMSFSDQLIHNEIEDGRFKPPFPWLSVSSGIDRKLLLADRIKLTLPCPHKSPLYSFCSTFQWELWNSS